jgi:putative intracellular protease/amidase
MRRVFCIVAALSLGLFLSGGTVAAQRAKRFVCPPCGSPCDGKTHDKPGTCPACGMALLDEDAAAALAHPHKRVAILVFDGVEIIDYTGPYEVFGAADFDVYLVGETKQPVTTSMGMTVVPKYSFAEAPQANVVVVPGGTVRAARFSAPTLEWVRHQTAQAEHTMSVCNGAFILANAGLLDGLTATTTARLIDGLRAEFPKTKAVYDQRFVDNGKIITTAGLSSGIDGALHVVSQMLGPGNAQAVALTIEYDWHPRSGFVRATLADMLIPQINLDAIGHWDFVRTEGGVDSWEMVFRGTSDRAVAEVMDHFARELASKGKWTRVGGAVRSPSISHWELAGRDGKPWKASLTIERAPGQHPTYTATLSIARIRS